MDAKPIAKPKDWRYHLHIPHFQFYVLAFFSEADWREWAEMAQLDDRSWMSSDYAGEVSRYGNHACVKLDGAVSDDVLVHEAVHAFQALCNYISESDPGSEVVAYTIQHIFAWLVKQKEVACCQ